MTRHDLTHSGEAVQPVTQFTYPLGRDAAVSHAAFIQRSLADVQAKLTQPQTRADHASLADREARYAHQLARLNAAGVVA